MLKILKETWAEIAFLLALAGGFWYLLEPPVGGISGIFSGFVGAIALGAALGLRAILHHVRGPRVSVVVLALGVVTLVAAVLLFTSYTVDRSNLVFEFAIGDGRTAKLIRGLEYRPGVDTGMKDYGELLSDAGGPNKRYLIWTDESIIQAEQRLARGYVLTALATLLGIMFFVEVLRLQAATQARNPEAES